MDKDTIQKIKDAITKSNNIGVAVGKNPSVDEMGAALSLYLLLKNANKQVSIASPTDPIVEVSSLVGVNKVQKTFGGESGDLVVSFPYLEGEIEKVSYTLEDGLLNIIVKASEQGLSFDESDVKYNRGSGAIDLLFVVGTPRISDLEDVIDSQKLRDIKIVNIDNKQHNEKFGDIVLVSQRFSSVSEQVADLTLTLGFRIDQDAAQNLLTGITIATENFQAANTSFLAFELAGLLMKRGAKRLKIGAAEKDEFISSLSQNEEKPQVDQRPQEGQRQPGQDRPNLNRQDNFRQSRPTSQDFARGEQKRQADTQQAKQNQDQDNTASDDSDDEPPLDWLTPKVYKGSSDVE